MSEIKTKLPVTNKVNYYYYYFNNKPSLTVCVINTGQDFLIGMSLCSLNDNPEKKVGRAQAFERAVMAEALKADKIAYERIYSEKGLVYQIPEKSEFSMLSLSDFAFDSHTAVTSVDNATALQNMLESLRITSRAGDPKAYAFYKKVFGDPQGALDFCISAQKTLDGTA